jgi:hypothetical protein
LTACAAATPDGIKIQAKEMDYRHVESARLWSAMVVEIGGVKSPSMESAIGPLRAIQAKWAKEDAPAYAAWQNARASHKKGDMFVPTRPRQRQIYTSGLTIEGLRDTLVENADGMLVFQDELSGFVASFDAYREGKGSKDRPDALELYNGGPRPINRAGRLIQVPNWSACILGGIQPDKMRKLTDLADDGFLQRFMVYGGRDVGQEQDRLPDKAAVDAYTNVVRNLVLLEANRYVDPIKFSPEAHKWRKEINDFAYHMRHLPETPPAVKGHLAKWRGLFARLVLTMHAIESAADDRALAATVPEATAKRVRDLMLGFLWPSAHAFYSEFFKAPNKSDKAVEWIARHLLSHGLEEITFSQIKKASRALENNPDAIHPAMEALGRLNWVGEPDSPRTDSTRWQVNTAIHKRFAKQAEAERADKAEKRRRLIVACKTRDKYLAKPSGDSGDCGRANRKGESG